MAMRVDYPTENPTVGAIAGLIAHIMKDKAEGILAIAYLPDGVAYEVGAELLARISVMARENDIKTEEALVVFNGRFRSSLCQDLACCPIEGNAIPDTQSARITAELVADGKIVPPSSREELERDNTPTSEDYAEAVDRFKFRESIDEGQAYRKAGALAIADWLATGTQDPERLALVIASLEDIQVRDYALGLDIPAEKLRELCLLAPMGFRAPIASLTAGAFYEAGNGALANHFLDVALTDVPNYSLGVLLRRVFGAGWPPASFAEMRRELHPKVCEGIFGE